MKIEKLQRWKLKSLNIEKLFWNSFYGIITTLLLLLL